MWKTLLLATLTVVNADFVYLEPGFDYVDHDLDNAHGGTPDSCLPLCTANPDCNAFSWNDFNGGTCWLKSVRDVIAVKGDVTSSLLWPVDMTSTVCQPQFGFDFVDNDLAHFSPKPFWQCCEVCHKFLGCRAYSWNSDNGGTCWLKSKRGDVVPKAGVISAIAYPEKVDFGLDYVDHDIDNKPSTSYQGCYSLCANVRGCHAFVWTDFAGGTCWLKAKKDVVVPKVGAIAAQVSPRFGNCNFDSNTDYPGNDIGSTPGIGNSQDCCPICRATPNCKAFSWSSFMGGTCWLKSFKGATQSNGGVMSGTVV